MLCDVPETDDQHEALRHELSSRPGRRVEPAAGKAVGVAGRGETHALEPCVRGPAKPGIW